MNLIQGSLTNTLLAQNPVNNEALLRVIHDYGHVITSPLKKSLADYKADDMLENEDSNGDENQIQEQKDAVKTTEALVESKLISLELLQSVFSVFLNGRFIIYFFPVKKKLLTLNHHLLKKKKKATGLMPRIMMTMRTVLRIWKWRLPKNQQPKNNTIPLGRQCSMQCSASTAFSIQSYQRFCQTTRRFSISPTKSTTWIKGRSQPYFFINFFPHFNWCRLIP
jgi:hypothetical protein